MNDAAAPEAVGAIWKTTVSVGDLVTVEMPKGSTLLDVGDQGQGGGLLSVWFFVPNVLESETEVRKLAIAGTGHTIDPKVWCANDYWKTVITAGGALVWHVFLEGEK